MIGFLSNVHPIGREGPAVTVIQGEAVPTIGYTLVDNQWLGDPVEEARGQGRNVWVWTAYNTDGVPTLYAFPDQPSRALARLITGCPGIGPVVASRVVQSHGYPACVRALSSDSSALARGVHGLSAKKAEELARWIRPKLSDIPDEQGAERSALAEGIRVLHGQVDHQVLERACELKRGGTPEAILQVYNELIVGDV